MEIHEAMSAWGRKGGSSKSEAKRKASCETITKARAVKLARIAARKAAEATEQLFTSEKVSFRHAQLQS